jgi:hypothetical protein
MGKLMAEEGEFLMLAMPFLIVLMYSYEEV